MTMHCFLIKKTKGKQLNTGTQRPFYIYDFFLYCDTNDQQQKIVQQKIEKFLVKTYRFIIERRTKIGIIKFVLFHKAKNISLLNLFMVTESAVNWLLLLYNDTPVIQREKIYFGFSFNYVLTSFNMVVCMFIKYMCTHKSISPEN